MKTGYFILRGDRTTCGGIVLEGEPNSVMGRAREGDRVTCGANGRTYAILGGVAYFKINGQRIAGTLDSASGCPCHAQFIPSACAEVYQRPASAAAPDQAAQCPQLNEGLRR